jgi:hypothetical protein
MNPGDGTLADLVEIIRERCPECLRLAAAQTDEDFEEAIDARLERGIAHLERNSQDFATLGETGLTAVLVGALNGYGLAVTQEANSNGHVDITMEVCNSTPMRRYLAEAKIDDGPVYHVKGVQQLLDRYTTGREGRGMVVAYVKKPDITGRMKAVRDHMDAELPCQQRGPTSDHSLKWSFLSVHGHSSGSDCRVGHVGCNLHRPPTGAGKSQSS